MASRRILDDKINTLNRIASVAYPPDQYNKASKSLTEAYDYKFSIGKPFTDVDAYVYSLPGHRPPIDVLKWKRNGATKEILSYDLLRWIKSKLVYFFDPDVEKQFGGLDSEDLFNMPLSVLNRLPASEFFVSVDTSVFDWVDSDNNRPLGFLFVVDRNYANGRTSDNSTSGFQITLIFDYTEESKHANVSSRALAYMGIKPTDEIPMTFKELLISNISEIYRKSQEWRNEYETFDAAEWESGLDHTTNLYCGVLAHALPYILYLCSENAELHDDAEKTYRPWTIEPKHKYREIDQIACGTELGKRIRSFKNNSNVVYASGRTGKGRNKAPHHRRAHFHKFWVGSGEDKHVVIKWLQEMYIHKDAQVIVTGIKV